MEIYDGRFDRKAPPTEHTARVVSVGYIRDGEERLTVRRRGRRDATLLYVEEGTLRAEGEVLTRGMARCYLPSAPQRYEAAADAGYWYLHFHGRDTVGLLSSLGIDTEHAFSAPPLSEGLRAIGDAMEKGGVAGALCAEGELLKLLSLLFKKKADAALDGMDRVLTHMAQHFAEKYDAHRYAAMAGLSRSRFDHAFLERTGFSPGRYYTRLRIAVACHLLREGECSVRLVSERVGYGDPLYFARLFRRETGCTPSAYQRGDSLP